VNHPGKDLDVMLKRAEIARSALAKHIGVSPSLITDIIYGSKRITPLMSVRLGKSLGMAVDWFATRQLAHDIEILAKENKGIRRMK
jgi:addiction module HigA family antidote